MLIFKKLIPRITEGKKKGIHFTKRYVHCFLLQCCITGEISCAGSAEPRSRSWVLAFSPAFSVPCAPCPGGQPRGSPCEVACRLGDSWGGIPARDASHLPISEVAKQARGADQVSFPVASAVVVGLVASRSRSDRPSTGVGHGSRGGVLHTSRLDSWKRPSFSAVVDVRTWRLGPACRLTRH